MRKTWIKFIKWLGYSYLMNTRSNEVHDTNNTRRGCKMSTIADKNKKYITEKKFLKLYDLDQADGCRWCMKQYNRAEQLKSR